MRRPAWVRCPRSYPKRRRLGPSLRPLNSTVLIPLPASPPVIPRATVLWPQLASLLEQLGGTAERRPMGLLWKGSAGPHAVVGIEGHTGAIEDLVLRTEHRMGPAKTSREDRNAHLNALNVRSFVACAIDPSRSVLLHRSYMPVGATFDVEGFLRLAQTHDAFWASN